MRIIFYLLVLALLVYEAVALGNRTTGDTISEIIWDISRRPFIPFAFGLLMGHFFWRMCNGG